MSTITADVARCDARCPHGGGCSLDPGHAGDHQALTAARQSRPCSWPRDPGESPACPPSAVRDLILPWAGVAEGDLVLWDGEFHLVEQRMLNTLRPDIKVSFRLHSVGMWQTFLLDRLTAVRRYEEG